MKKVLSIIAIAAMSTAFVSCGQSKEEMEKRKQLQEDSIAAVEKAKQDSAAAVAGWWCWSFVLRYARRVPSRILQASDRLPYPCAARPVELASDEPRPWRYPERC